MQRKPTSKGKNSTHFAQSGPKFDAERSIRELQDRIARLERIVQDLGGSGFSEVEASLGAQRKKRGPKPIHHGMLISGRNELVQMLEFYWPELEPLCLPKPKPEALREFLSRIARHLQGSQPSEARHLESARHLLKHLPKIVDVLTGGRFSGDPRQIANACAGFPTIGFWRSLKVCQAEACNDPIGNRAIRAYIRRKHPELYGRLSAEHSLLNFATALKTYRTKEQRLNAFGADFLYQCWSQCKADYSTVGD